MISLDYARDLTKQIDASVELVETYPVATMNVFRVKRDDSQECSYILKSAVNCNSWYFKQLNLEIEILNMTRNIEGVTRLLQVYNLPDYLAILKEFFPGDTLREIGRRINMPHMKRDLEETLDSLHRLGIANLDIFKQDGCNNIVYSYELRKAKFIDLVSDTDQMIFTDLESPEFKNAVDSDRRRLRSLFY